MSKLFRGVVQFSPGTLQEGEGAGWGLYSKIHYCLINIPRITISDVDGCVQFAKV